jgi:molybdopterin converting factor small subunit
MKVKLNLHPIIIEQIGDITEFELPPDSTLGSLVQALKLSALRTGFAMVNGKRATEMTVLHDGDTVFFMPFLGGG